MKLIVGTKFQLKRTRLIFWTKLAQEGCFRSKTEKSEQCLCIQHIRISRGPKFQLKLTILTFFYQICPKSEFSFKNGKNALVRASMFVTHYIKLIRTRADRHNGILTSLLLLVVEGKSIGK